MCSPSMKWCGCVVLPGRYGLSRHPQAFLWLFTLLNTGVEWGADGRKLHPFSTCPVPDSPRAGNPALAPAVCSWHFGQGRWRQT